MTTVSCAAGFGVEVIGSKFTRRSAVRSSALLDELRGGTLRVMGRFPTPLLAQRAASRQALQRQSAQAAPVTSTNAAGTNRRGDDKT